MSYRTENVTMWFDRRIVLRKSPIEGTGTFATEEIHAGETLMFVTGGVVYTTEDWKTGKVRLQPDRYNEDRIGDDLFVATPVVFQYFINHSCSPNAFDISTFPTATQYVAWRDIQPDEEVTTDYGVYGNSSIAACGCGSALCRGKVTPDDWQLPDLQERYRGWFPTRLVKRAPG